MEDYIFEIENLKCAYAKREDIMHRVLDIDTLLIPKGKMVFFVGPSGIGKSTILEVLGLMNDTVVSVDKFLYKGKDIKQAWSWSDDVLSDFRNKEFSFIFQDNNLMPNFSAYENVMVAAMIQGTEKQKALEETKQILELLNLPVNEDKDIRQYSGGQRQRLAFARAILPDFNVIFGDEPTGNLDRGSAERVTKILEERVHSKNVTAIIVSHDMRLAVKYADMIIRINKKDKGIDEEGNQKYYGYIGKESIFFKDEQGWYQQGNRYPQTEFLKLLEEGLK